MTTEAGIPEAQRAIVADDRARIALVLYAEPGALAAIALDRERALRLAGDLLEAALQRRE